MSFLKRKKGIFSKGMDFIKSTEEKINDAKDFIETSETNLNIAKDFFVKSPEAKIYNALKNYKFGDALELMDSNNFKPNRYIKNREGQRSTLLIEAVRAGKGNLEVIQKLIEAGADVSKKNLDDGNHVLMHVWGDDKLKVAKLLIDSGARPYMRDSHGDKQIDLVKLYADRSFEKGYTDSGDEYMEIYYLYLNRFEWKRVKRGVSEYVEQFELEYARYYQEIKDLLDNPKESFNLEDFEKLDILSKNIIAFANESSTNKIWDARNDSMKEFVWSKGHSKYIMKILELYIGDLIVNFKEKIKKYNENINDLSKVVNKKYLSGYYFMRGTYLLSIKEYNLAINFFSSIKGDILIADQKLSEFKKYEQLIVVYMNLKDYKNAYSNMEIYFKDVPSSFFSNDLDQQFFNLFSYVFLMSGHSDKGINWIKSFKNDSVDISEMFTELNIELENWNELGEYFESIGRFKDALEYFEKAGNTKKLISLNEEKSDYKTLAKIYESKGELVEAAENFEKAKLYEDAKNIWLRIKSAKRYFSCLTKLSNIDLSELEKFDLEDTIQFGIKYDLTETIADYIINLKYNSLESSHVKTLQPLYSELLSIKNKTEKINYYIIFLSLKFDVKDVVIEYLDEIFNKLFSNLLKSNFSDEQSKIVILKLLQLNGYRISNDIYNSDYHKIQSKLFDEFRLLNLDSYQGYENILKYKISNISFQEDWNSFNSYISLINTEYTSISKFGKLFKILIENLLDNSKDKLDAINQYWRYSKKDFKDLNFNSDVEISDQIYELEQFQPEFLITNYWNNFFFSKKTSSEEFSNVYNNIIKTIDVVSGNHTDENTSILIVEFLNFYNNFNDQFKANLEKENQILVLSKICSLVEKFDVTLHTNIVDILDNDYNYEYGI